jgi:hypothetical protein
VTTKKKSFFSISVAMMKIQSSIQTSKSLRNSSTSTPARSSAGQGSKSKAHPSQDRKVSAINTRAQNKDSDGDFENAFGIDINDDYEGLRASSPSFQPGIAVLNLALQ